MNTLHMNNWDSVLSYVKNHGLPIKKVQGRWLANRARLLEWYDSITAADTTKSVQNCAHAQISTLAKEAHARKRSHRMNVFLANFVSTCSTAKACRVAGIGRTTVYLWRKVYPRFNIACQCVETDALEQGIELLSQRRMHDETSTENCNTPHCDETYNEPA